jgi:hypothetical protein
VSCCTPFDSITLIPCVQAAASASSPSPRGAKLLDAAERRIHADAINATTNDAAQQRSVLREIQTIDQTAEHLDL